MKNFPIKGILFYLTTVAAIAHTVSCFSLGNRKNTKNTNMLPLSKKEDKKILKQDPSENSNQSKDVNDNLNRMVSLTSRSSSSPGPSSSIGSSSSTSSSSSPGLSPNANQPNHTDQSSIKCEANTYRSMFSAFCTIHDRLKKLQEQLKSDGGKNTKVDELLDQALETTKKQKADGTYELVTLAQYAKTWELSLDPDNNTIEGMTRKCEILRMARRYKTVQKLLKKMDFLITDKYPKFHEEEEEKLQKKNQTSEE